MMSKFWRMMWGVSGLLACSWSYHAQAMPSTPVQKTPLERLTAQAQLNTQEMQLSNGLKVIVRRDTRAPVVVSQLWYHVGSNDEVDTISGVSHALEHMMFRGTKTVKDGEFSKMIAALGGRQNAFTSANSTVYFTQIAKQHLSEVLRLEADRMRNLTLDGSLFAKEIQVIREERRQTTEDRVGAYFMEQVRAHAILQSHARQPIIGWASDIERMRVEDLVHWYRRWYHPDFATLVVVGDVEAREVFHFAKRYFGAIPSSVHANNSKTDRPNWLRRKNLQSPATGIVRPSAADGWANFDRRKLVPEPEQAGMRQIVLQRPSELAYLALAWRVPYVTGADWTKSDAVRLTVLGFVLDGLAASRLPKNIVRKAQLATSVGAYFDPFSRGAALFTVTAATKDRGQLKAVREAILQEIQAIAQFGVDEQELKRLHTQFYASKVFERDSLFAQAMNIGQLESLGLGWQREHEWMKAILSVTSAELQAVAQKYFVDSRLTWGELEPLKMTP